MTVANVNVTKVLMKRGNTAQNAAYTGVNGEVVVDLQAKTLRIHDGSTVGGFVITAGGVIGAYSNTNTAAYLNSQSITSANIGGSQTFANANAAVQATSINNINANIGSYQTFANSNAAAQAVSISTIDSNIGSYQTFANANAAIQATAINSINANLGAYQTYANATFGTSSYANANVKAYLSQFDGNINPSANVTYSLGNITHQWRDLWVSNNTIYIGNTPIRVDGGTLLVNNAPITAGSTYGNANVATYLSRGNVTVGNITIQDEYDQQWRFSNGALIWPAGDGTPTGPYIEGSILMTVYPENDGEFRIQTYSTTAVGSRQWKFTSEGNLIVPDDATIHSDLDLRLYAETGNIALGNQNGTWMFDNDGRFTAPGDVYGQYFTLRGGNGPGAEIGSLGYGGNVVTIFGTEGFDVQTGDPEIGPKWQFGTDGNLTLPNNGYLNLFGGDIWQTPDQDLAIRVRDADNDDFELRLEVDDGADNVHSRLRQRRDDIQIGLGLTGTAKYYRFRDTGDLEIPGDIDGEYGGSTSLKIRGASATSFVTLKTVDNTDTLRSNVSVGSDNVTISTGTAAYNWTFGNDGNITLPTNASLINYANGVSILQGIGGTYSNTNVAAYLNNGFTVAVGPINFTASPPASSSPGINWPNGFQSSRYGNTEVALYLTENNYITSANLSGYATTASPTFTGTLTSSGNIAAQANVTVTNNMTVLGNLTVQGTTTTVSATTLTLSDKIITVANGSTNNNEANNAGLYVPGSAANILYTSTDDAWTLNKTISGTANIKAAGWVIGTTFAYANSVNILSELYSNAAAQATSITTLTANAATQQTSINTINANLGAYQAYANATFSVSSYGNTNVAAYLAGNVSVGNLQIGNAFRLNGLDNSLTTTNGSAVQFWQRVNFNSASGIYSSGTINAQSGTASGSTGTGAIVVSGGMGVSGNIHIGSSNSNSVVAAGSIVAANYNFANGVNILSTVTAGSTYSNVNVEAYIGGNIGAYQTFANANAAAQATSINSISANIGAFQTFSNSNSATQATSINTINANLGSFQTYANNTFGGSSYGNAAVAAFLLTYTGNVAAGNVTVVSTVTAANIVTTGTYGNITGANVISANTFVFGANGVNILTAVAGGATDNELRANVGAYQIFANANAAVQATSIDTVNANIGSYQTFANANAATQATSINTINANLGSFQSYANATFGTSNYGNANVAAYLVTNPPSGTYSNTNVAAYLPTYTGTLAGGLLNLSGGDPFTTATLGVGEIIVNNGSSDTPGIHFYQGNNDNFGIDVENGTLRFVKNLDEAGGTIIGRINSSGDIIAIGQLQGASASITGSAGITGNLTAGNVAATQYNFANGVNILSTVAASSTYSNTNVEAYIGANIGSYQTFANANAAVQATSIDTINANLGAFQTYANATFGGSSYGNTQVAAYLTGNIVAGNINATQYNFANGVNILSTVGAGSYGNTEVAAYLLTFANANISTLNTTSANVTTLRAANFNSANAVISGGYISALTNASIITSTVVTQNITNGNVTTLRAANFNSANAVISGGYISALTNASIITSTVVTQNITNGNTTTLVATNFSTGNAVISGGYISGTANIAITSAGNISGVGNIIGTTSNTTITAGSYTTSFLTNGTATIGGNVTASGIAPFYAPNRPAFRVYGTVSTQIVAPTTVTSTNGTTVDFNQGGYYDNTTGIFTAPVPGLYHAYATLRVGSNNGLNQATIVKNNSVAGANVIAFWETDTNIGSAIHFSMTGYAQLTAGDTLRLRVLTGNINLDSNDSWGVTYIG